MPIPSIEVRSRGPRGKATITKYPDTLDVTFEEDGQTLSFSRRDPEAIGFDVGKVPFPAPSTVSTPGISTVDGATPEAPTAPTMKVYAEVSGDKKKLFGVRPLTGSFFAKVVGFAHAEDVLPAPKRYEGMGRKKDGTTFPYNFEGFNVLVEITEGAWVGTIYPSMLRYLFTDAGDGETCGIRTGGKHAQILANFLENAGLDFDVDTIPLSDNILPWLEAELVSRGARFMIVVGNGYVDSFAPAP